MFKKLRKTLTAAAACLVFFALSFVVYADNGSLKKTVRVGYTDYYGFIEQNPNGEFSGYGVDYLDELAHYTDWRYEYVYCNWDTAIEKLQNDEIDLLCNATPSAENRQSLAFSQYSIGVEQFVLYCLPTTDLCFDDFENFEGKNIGVLRHSTNSYALDEYARRNGFSYHKIDFDTDEELEAALYSGQVDAIAAIHLAPYKDLKLIAKHGSSPTYIVMANESKLYPALSRALSSIKSDTPEFDGELYRKYYGDSLTATQPMFTRAEQAFIDSSAPIKVGLWSDRIPISYLDPKTKELCGVNPRVLDELSIISGLKFEYVPVKQEVALTDTLSSGETQIICGPPDLDDYFKNSNYRASVPFHTSKMVFVGQGNSISKPRALAKIATPKSTKAANYYLKKNYPAYTPVPVNSILDGLYGVANGTADMILCDEYLASYYLQKPTFSKLKAFSGYSIKEPSVIVSLDSEDDTLMSIINKSISVLPREKVEDIVIAQIANASYQPNAVDAIYQYGLEAVILFSLVGICFYLVLKTSENRKNDALKLKKINDELSLQQKRYKLVMSQTRDVIFEWDYVTKEIEYSDNFAEYLHRQPLPNGFPTNPELLASIHPDDVENFLALYGLYDSGATCATGEYRLKNGENVYFWCRSRSTAVLDEEGHITTVIGVLSDISSEKAKLMEVEILASRDTLTGLCNRRSAQEAVEQFISKGKSGAMFMLDIDNFKGINDTFGHSVGDTVLQDVAHVLSTLFRGKDVVSRLGGDEFLVFITDAFDKAMVTCRAQEVVDEISFIQCNGFAVSVSLGVAFFPEDGACFAALYQKADDALYKAKNNGKNQFSI